VLRAVENERFVLDSLREPSPFGTAFHFPHTVGESSEPYKNLYNFVGNAVLGNP